MITHNNKIKTKNKQLKYSASSSNINQSEDITKNYETLPIFQSRIKSSLLNKRSTVHIRNQSRQELTRERKVQTNHGVRKNSQHVKQQSKYSNIQKFLQNIKVKSNNKSNQVQTEKKQLTANIKKNGKLVLGKNNQPKLILSKQSRWNPFGTTTPIITQSIIQSKGLINLVSLGLFPKNYDYNKLLNNKYQLVVEQNQHFKAEQKYNEAWTNNNQAGTFLTNPIMMSQYERLKKDSQFDLMQNEANFNSNFSSLNNINQQNKIVQKPLKKSIHYKSNQKIILIEDNQIKQGKNKIRKSKPKKIKAFTNQRIVKDQIAQIFKMQLPILEIKNFFISKSEQYQNYYKICLKYGNQVQFNYGVKQVEQFCLKYNIKKVKFKPKFNLMTKKFNQTMILSLIQDHKILGIDKCMMKNKNLILEQVIKRGVIMFRYRKMKSNIKKIDQLKKYFRIRKIFYETIEKRYNFTKYKLGSFAQEQRRFLQSFQEKKLYSLQSSSLSHSKQKSSSLPKNHVFNVEIHILTLNYDIRQQRTYYKLSERLRIHLTRLFSTSPEHLILIIDQKYGLNIQSQMATLFKMIKNQQIKNQKLSSRKTHLHVFETSFPDQFNVSQSAAMYFGLSPKIINQIKYICEQTKPIIIPYKSSRYLPQICQALEGNLLGGTYTPQSLFSVFSEQQQQSPNIDATNQVKNNQVNSFKIKRQIIAQKRKKLDQIVLSTFYFEQKNHVIQFFKQNNIPVPFHIVLKTKEKKQFFNLFAEIILTKKQINKWVLKLPKSNFSRGLAFFSTLELKIVQESRKKIFTTTEDIRKLAQLLPIILIDKISLSHPSLWEKAQFIEQFLESQGYIQQYVQNSEACCLFGRIMPTGIFQFLGSYKKVQTSTHICCGALYPAQQIKQKTLQKIKQLTKSLFKQNFFGYITFQLLFQRQTQKSYFIDLVPNLEEYSSLHFLYNNMFKAQQIYSQYFSFNTLPKHIFYIPFVDNNGNQFQNIQDFIDQCVRQKVWYNPLSQEGQKFIFLKNDPNVLSLISFANSQLQTIKYSIDAISFLIQNGGKFNQFDIKQKSRDKHKQNYDEGLRKTDGLYIMDILWKLRELKKQQESKFKQAMKK